MKEKRTDRLNAVLPEMKTFPELISNETQLELEFMDSFFEGFLIFSIPYIIWFSLQTIYEFMHF